VKHLSAKDLRHGADGEQEPSSRRHPGLLVDVEGAAGDDEVDVGMVGEGLPPGVQDGEEAELTLEAIPAELQEGLRRGAEEGLVESGAGDGWDVDEGGRGSRGQG
jgi:hypothetical protein